MSAIVVAGDTSGSVTLQAQAVSGSTVITLPTTSGTMALSGGAGSFTTIEASSTIKGASTISVGGATPSTSGAGITFPATASLSTNANTLDDYEEGTWTPSPKFGGGNTGITGTFQGLYTKTGNTVYFSCNVNFTSKGSSTGQVQLTGLPFTSINSAVDRTMWCAFDGQGAINVEMYLPANTTTAVMYDVNTGAAITNTSFTDNTVWRVQGFYQV